MPPTQSTIPAFPARAAERQTMVHEQLRRRGITNEAVLAAMNAVPRELFLPPELADRAYEDAAVPVECGQSISQPFIVARMTELLAPRPTDRVLEIGGGTGYQTAILAQLVAHVYVIERHPTLLHAAALRWRALRLTNVTPLCADGSVGWPAEAPFDGILVAAGGPEVPRELTDQLDVGGRLVMPVGPMHYQILVRVVRTVDGALDRTDVLACRFVKLIGAAGWHES